jgi:hypothetical protein
VPIRRGSPMQTGCSAKPRALGRVEAGLWWPSSTATRRRPMPGPAVGGAADRHLDMVRRIAGCFSDARDPRFVEHSAVGLHLDQAVPAIGSSWRRRRQGARWRKWERRPLPGMMLHQDGSRHEWLAGCPAINLTGNNLRQKSPSIWRNRGSSTPLTGL